MREVLQKRKQPDDLFGLSALRNSDDDILRGHDRLKVKINLRVDVFQG